MSRVVVIGATGHIGSYLVPRLARGGHEVNALSRGIRGPYLRSPRGGSVTTVTVDRDAAHAQGSLGDQAGHGPAAPAARTRAGRAEPRARRRCGEGIRARPVLPGRGR